MTVTIKSCANPPKADKKHKKFFTKLKKTYDINGLRRMNVTSISHGNRSWIPAFAGMTEWSKCLSFPQKRESRKMAQQKSYPDLLRRYE